MTCDLPVPHASSSEPHRQRFLIDALNVAYWCGSPPALALPVILLTQLLRDGHDAMLYFDASARYQLATDALVYTQLLHYPCVAIEAPSGRTADSMLLRQARSSGACVLSRDKFRDHRRRFRKLIDDPARVMAGWVTDRSLVIPQLPLQVLLPASASDALVQLETLMPEHTLAIAITPSRN